MKRIENQVFINIIDPNIFNNNKDEDSILFKNCVFNTLTLQKLTIADCTFQRCVFENVHIQDDLITETHFEDTVFRDVFLTSSVMEKSSFLRCSLSSTTFIDSQLERTTFRNSIITQSNIHSCRFVQANLAYCSFPHTALRHNEFCGCAFDSVSFRQAFFYDTTIDNLERLKDVQSIIPDGDIIGWKKLYDGTLCKLLIPADALRVGGIVSRKCRASKAIVIEGEGVSDYDKTTVYTSGKTVIPDYFDKNPLEDCSYGIHFFLTRQEAEDYGK